MSFVTTADFNTIRDAMVTSINGGASQETAWAAAAAPVAAGKDANWLSNRGGLKPDIVKAVYRLTEKADGISTADIKRLGDVYARSLAAGLDVNASWTAAKAAFPKTTDTALEGNKAAALAWAADHQAGYPAA